MKIRCETCRREYVIPEDRLKNLAGSITLPCPNCRAPITVEPPGTAPRGNGPPSGDELRDKVLRSVKDLPPMPQVARKARASSRLPTRPTTDSPGRYRRSSTHPSCWA